MKMPPSGKSSSNFFSQSPSLFTNKIKRLLPKRRRPSSHLPPFRLSIRRMPNGLAMVKDGFNRWQPQSHTRTNDRHWEQPTTVHTTSPSHCHTRRSSPIKFEAFIGTKCRRNVNIITKGWSKYTQQGRRRK